MESFHHHKWPSSDRFLRLLSSRGKIGGDGGGELEEGDVFWMGADFAPRDQELSSGRASEKRFGILTALSEEESRKGLRSAGGLRRTPSSGWTIPTVPKPKREDQHLGVRQQSAPVSVPIAVHKVLTRFPAELEVDDDDDDDEMLPPHEIVAKGERTTFSVLEGAGRTLKGRDLRRVRNAVWRQTGFLD